MSGKMSGNPRMRVPEDVREFLQRASGDEENLTRGWSLLSAVIRSAESLKQKHQAYDRMLQNQKAHEEMEQEIRMLRETVNQLTVFNAKLQIEGKALEEQVKARDLRVAELEKLNRLGLDGG